MQRQVSRREFSQGTLSINTCNIPPQGHPRKSFAEVIDEVCGEDLTNLLQHMLERHGVTLDEVSLNLTLTLIGMNGNEHETIEIKSEVVKEDLPQEKDRGEAREDLNS
jgi:hypothetical protein